MAQRAAVPLEQSLPLAEEAERSSGLDAFVTIVRSLLLSKELWLQNLLGFLAARACLLGELYPFGPAFFLAVYLTGERRRTVAAALAVTAGAATVLPSPRVGALALAMLVALLLPFGRMPAPPGTQSLPADRRRPPVSPRAVFALSALMGIARVAPGWLGGTLGLEGVSAAVESFLAAVMALVIAPAAASRWFEEERHDRSSLLALGVVVVVAGLGLIDLTWGWVLLPEVWTRWVTLLAAVVGGAAGGAAVGTAAGVLTSLTGWQPVGGLGLYGVAGLFAGLCAGRGKAGAALGYLLGQMVVAVHADGPGEILLGAAHTAVAAGLLAAVPRRWIGRIERGIPGSDAQSALQLARERRLRAVLNERLNRVSAVFGELADVFGASRTPRPAAGDGENGIHAIVEYAWNRQCAACSGFTKCWERNFYSSYWETVDLVAAAERQGRATVENLPAGIRLRCHRPREFVAAINEARASNGGGDWSLERMSALDIVPYQLRGAADLVRRLAEQVGLETGRAEEVEARLWEEFELRRIAVRQVRVAETGTHPEIDVEYEGECDTFGSCAAAVLSAVEGVMQEAYTCEIQCREGLGEVCRIRLIPEPNYTLTVEMARLAKAEEVQSGDTCIQVDLGGGKVAVVLSDGMGTGERAAMESRATVGMLEKMMQAGFSRTFAVHTVNSVLLLRSAEEVFATLDLAVVDRFTGEVEFLKVGSSPTFIKRGREVEIVRSESLPIGILSEIEPSENSRRLQRGDVLVMMTDGILDALPDQADKEEWIARMLRRVETDEPAELVRLLVDRARQAAGGAVRDDMTVVVARLDQYRQA